MVIVVEVPEMKVTKLLEKKSFYFLFSNLVCKSCCRTKTCERKSESESDVTCGQVWLPILGICALHLTHPKCTHTAVNTHTHREHTPGAVGSHLCCGARGAVGGSVPCSRAPQSWY